MQVLPGGMFRLIVHIPPLVLPCTLFLKIGQAAVSLSTGRTWGSRVERSWYILLLTSVCTFCKTSDNISTKTFDSVRRQGTLLSGRTAAPATWRGWRGPEHGGAGPKEAGIYYFSLQCVHYVKHLTIYYRRIVFKWQTWDFALWEDIGDYQYIFRCKNHLAGLVLL